MDRNEHPLEPRHLGVPSVASRTISEPMVCSTKPCIYLASRLALSPNRPKRASTRVSSPRSTIGCIQKDLWAYGTFGAKRAPILHRCKHYLQMVWNEIPHDPQVFYQVCPKWFASLWYIRRKPCTYFASKLALSPKRPKWSSTWALSPRSAIGCVQNNFWAYGTFCETVQLSCIKISTISK
jgi:hypothetical protein